VLRTSNPAWPNRRRLSRFGWQPPERGQAVLDDCTPSLTRANMLDEQGVPSPENVGTEVTKALEQIS
jgi:hypothetical protein